MSDTPEDAAHKLARRILKRYNDPQEAYVTESLAKSILGRSKSMDKRLEAQGKPRDGSTMPLLDRLAQEIRRVDGNHTLGAGQLAAALLPAIDATIQHWKDTADTYMLEVLQERKNLIDFREHVDKNYVHRMDKRLEAQGKPNPESAATQTLRELIDANLVVRANSEGRWFVALLNPNGDHLFSAPHWGWYEGTVQHRDAMVQRLLEVIQPAADSLIEAAIERCAQIAEQEGSVGMIQNYGRITVAIRALTPASIREEMSKRKL